MANIEQLIEFGLTRQEATIYEALYASGELTGYEVSKLTGISRSNVYNALAGLVEKGASYVLEWNPTKYMSVDIQEFCDNKILFLQELSGQLCQSMPRKKKESEGYITISGKRHIIDKIRHMLCQAEERVYLSIDKAMVESLREDLILLAKSGIKTVLITEPEVDIPGVRIYQGNPENGQVRIIVDSNYVLTGDVNNEESTCLYSSKKNLVDVFKEALRNEMKLIEITKGVLS